MNMAVAYQLNNDYKNSKKKRMKPIKVIMRMTLKVFTV